MNEFDHDISGQKNLHWRRLTIVGLLLLVIVLLIVLLIGVSKSYTFYPVTSQSQLKFSYEINNGRGVFYNNKLYALSSETEITISADKYSSVHLTLNEKNPSNIEFKLNPLPGKLIITSEPFDKNTTWFLNNEPVSTGSELSLELKEGRYQIKLNSPYFEPITKSIEIGKGEQISRHWHLQPIEGIMNIDTHPQNAKIYLNGKLEGNSPFKVNKKGGRYAVKVEKQGYQAIVDIINITNKSKITSRDYQLLLKNATLKLLLQPADGKLLIDGKEIEPGSEINLSAHHEHQILYEKAGYGSYSRVINLRPHETRTLKIALKPQISNLFINSQPRSEVRIDGQIVGRTPVKIALPSIPHRIELMQKGYRTALKTIHPEGNRDLSLEVKLLSEFEARRLEGRPTFAKQLGINMVAFHPQKFVMGSPFNEPGRRRNESFGEVDLNKDFFVSSKEITESIYHHYDTKILSSQFPVSDISWMEAVKFCNWLSKEEGLQPYYQIQRKAVAIPDKMGKGYRLPTEAEWEWLARKANRSESTRYPWGDSEELVDKIGNFADQSLQSSQTFYFKNYQDGFKGKAPVGSFQSEVSGLYDMAGNVSEWVQDYYSIQNTNKLEKNLNPFGPEKGFRHFYKGANFLSGRVTELRSAYREPLSGKSQTVGFRIVRFQ